MSESMACMLASGPLAGLVAVAATVVQPPPCRPLPSFSSPARRCGRASMDHASLSHRDLSLARRQQSAPLPISAGTPTRGPVVPSVNVLRPGSFNGGWNPRV